MNFLRKLHKYLPLIGILLFLIILWRIGLPDIVSSLFKINLFYLVIYLFLMILVTFIQVFKWYYIVNLQNIKINFYDAFKFHIVSSFLGSITPSRIGLLSKIVFLRKNTNRSMGECASSVILDKSLDFVLLFIFSFFGSLLLLKRYNFNILLGLFLLIFIIGFLFLFNKKVARFFLKWIYKYFVPKKFKEKARLNFDGFYDTMPSFKKIFTPFLVTLLVWIILYTQAYVLALGFGIKIPYFYFISVIAIVTLVTLIPITILGIGTRELSLIALFSSFSIKSSNLIAFSITSSFLGPFFLFIGYMFYAKKISWDFNNGKEKIN